MHSVGIELDLRAPHGGIELRGIIDRLDIADDGRFVLSDYKTGRSPRPDRARSRLAGVLFYAHFCASLRHRHPSPSEVRLVYLADEVVIVEEPSDQSMRGLLQRASAVWSAIERACNETGTTSDRSPVHTALQELRLPGSLPGVRRPASLRLTAGGRHALDDRARSSITLSRSWPRTSVERSSTRKRRPA